GGLIRRGTLIALAGLLIAGYVETRVHPPQSIPRSADFGNAVRLVGAWLDRPPAARPEVGGVNLEWEGLTGSMGACDVRIRLLDAQGRVVARRDKAPSFGARPCSTWPAGEIVHDLEEIRLPPGVAAGTYRLAVGLTI